MTGPDTREIVLDTLLEREKHDTFSNVLIHDTLDRYASLPLTQRSFIKRLFEGTVERQPQLDRIVKERQSNGKTRLRPPVRCILRLAVYEILYMDSVPDHAACDEAVRLVKKRGEIRQAGFVNAILRRVCREKEEILREYGDIGSLTERAFEGTLDEEGLKTLAVRCSIPFPIAKMWERQYGMDRAAHLLPSFMEARPVCIRLDPRESKEERSALLAALKESGVRIRPARYAKDAFLLEHVPDMETLPGFSEGRWTVQDESSQLAVLSAGLSGNMTVIDLCAAPGGKTAYMAQLLPEGKILAFDLSEKKVERMRENLTRLRLSNCRTGVNDAAVLNENLIDAADMVLCDVPCSGLGIMTKKRDIKYGFDGEKIRSLSELQRRILDNAVRYVKPGGIFLYSTCTIGRTENDEQADYLEREKGLLPVSLEGRVPPALLEKPGWNFNRLQLFPDLHGTDGFFFALFRRPQQ